MKQEELNKIIERHQHYLREDREGWKEMKADLSGADLRKANLCGVNILKANITGANLTGAKRSE